MTQIVRVVDRKSGKAAEIPCEKHRACDCMNWLADRLAYEIVTEDAPEETPFGKIYDEMRERKDSFEYQIFDAITTAS